VARFLFIVVCLLLAITSWADTVYIAPTPAGVLMYNGPSQQANILMVLPKGSKVQRLLYDKDTGFALIRTSANKEGWVHNSALSVHHKAPPHPVVQSIQHTTVKVTQQMPRVAKKLHKHQQTLVSKQSQGRLELLLGILIFLISLIIGLLIPVWLDRRRS